MCKCFFWHQQETCLAVLQEYIFYYVEWVEVHKMSEIFWAKLYSKMIDLFLLVFVGFGTFCQNSEISRWPPSMRFLIIYFWVQILFLCNCFKTFKPVKFKIVLLSANHDGGWHFYSAPTIKKFPMAPGVEIMTSQWIWPAKFYLLSIHNFLLL